MPIKDTLTLEDAVRLTGPLSFNIMLKPAGSLCNLDCQYCCYLDKAEIYVATRSSDTTGISILATILSILTIVLATY